MPADDLWDDRQRALDASFLQSSDWEIFHQSMGTKTHKLQDKDWSCLLIERPSKLGRYLFAPYGPTLKNPTALQAALQAAAELGRKEGAHWLRIEAGLGVLKDSELDRPRKAGGLKIVKAPKQIDPRLTRLLDLTQSEDELLAAISQGTRQRIRKGLKQPQLEYRTSDDPEDMPLFMTMLGTVAERNKAFFHSDEYFQKQAEALMPRGHMRLEIALHDGKPVACFVIHDYNGTATYTYAGSLPEARDLQASTLLMWHVITSAKARGMTTLDLFGVAPDDAPKSHPWYGFTSFKRQLGGRNVMRGETWDIPLHPRYKLYRAALKAGRWL